MILINGRPESQIEYRDRGLMYGDGLFETIRVVDGELRLWFRHLARLKAGLLRMGIPAPRDDELLSEANQLCAKQSGVLRLTVTRGVGARGYRCPKAVFPTRVLDFSPTDFQSHVIGLRVRLCNFRLSIQPGLAGMKHLNRLEQVMARREWEDDFEEGLMLDTEGRVVEGTMSNVFLVDGERLITPSLERCGVDGVLRRLVLDVAADHGLQAVIADILPEELNRVDGAFMTNSLTGIRPVIALEGRPMPQSDAVTVLQASLEGLW